MAHVEYGEPLNKYRPANKANIVEIPAQLTVCTKQQNFCNTSVSVPIFPDSGASICLAGPSLLKILNIDPENMLRCNVEM